MKLIRISKKLIAICGLNSQEEAGHLIVVRYIDFSAVFVYMHLDFTGPLKEKNEGTCNSKIQYIQYLD